MFVLIGSDADLRLLKKLGVKTESGKLTEMPVYDPETFETNVPGVYVARATSLMRVTSRKRSPFLNASCH